MGKKVKGNGEGTIYKSGRTGLYVGQYTTSGKRHTVYQRKNEKIGDFKKRFNDILSSIHRGDYITESSISLFEILESHIKDKHANGIIVDRTYIRNQETLKALELCCSNFINKPIQKVTIEDIKKTLPNFRSVEFESPKTKKNIKKVYSQNTINKMYAMLCAGFKIAYQERVIKYNLMENNTIKKPKSLKETLSVEALTVDEEKKLIDILRSQKHKYNNILLVALFSGMRIGEILALTRNDIDLKENTININKTLTRDINDKVIIGKTTKTVAGKRVIYLNTQLKKIFSIVLNENITNMYGLVFFNYKDNKVITPNEVNCYLQRLNNKHDICKHIHTHMLRHTYATRCIEAGMSAKVLQKNLGHTKIETTLNTYTSVFEKFNIEENEKYDNYINSII